MENTKPVIYVFWAVTQCRLKTPVLWKNIMSSSLGLKHWYLSMHLHGIRTQKNIIIILTTIRTSNLTLEYYFNFGIINYFIIYLGSSKSSSIRLSLSRTTFMLWKGNKRQKGFRNSGSQHRDGCCWH